MRIAVLGASGRTGGILIDQAIQRGHQVIALVRSPRGVALQDSRQIDVRQADVFDPQTFPAIDDADVVVSAIGISKGDRPGALVAGAQVLAEAGVRTVWLGALGSGVSRRSGGAVYALVMRLFVGGELAEKAEADQIALAAGATVFHAPDVANGQLSATRHVVRLAEMRRPLLPPRISRTTLASLLLDEAETGKLGPGIFVPLS